jgi:hypothetical protein
MVIGLPLIGLITLAAYCCLISGDTNGWVKHDHLMDCFILGLIAVSATVLTISAVLHEFNETY